MFMFCVQLKCHQIPLLLCFYYHHRTLNWFPVVVGGKDSAPRSGGCLAFPYLSLLQHSLFLAALISPM